MVHAKRYFVSPCQELGLLMPSETKTACADQSVEELRRELVEAREQQAATAGILAAISNSPTDPYRVFAEFAASAARLCDAEVCIHPTLSGLFIGPTELDNDAA